MNEYCERCKVIRPFVLRRSNEGTIWECEVCHFVIRDLGKYKLHYSGLPVEEPRAKQPKIL